MIHRDELPDTVERALRAARPTEPPLSESRADRLLARALAESRASGRRKACQSTVAATLAMAACMVAAGLLLARHPLSPQPKSIRVAQSARPAKLLPPEAKTAASGRDPSHPSRRPSPFYPRLPEFANRERHRRLATRRYLGARFLRPRHARVAAFRAAAHLERATEPVRGTEAANGSASNGHLVVIVFGAPALDLRVDVTTGETQQSGFAKVEAYTPTGPGSGILTRCTVRDSAGESEVTTANYGFADGQPISCLSVAASQPAASLTLDERGTTP